MVAPNKQRMVTKLVNVLSKTYDDKVPDELSVLDHLLLGVIQEGTSLSHALKCYEKIISVFRDLNELRVSHHTEVQGFLNGIPDREEKAKRIIAILQFVFETTYAFDLESMKRKPLKQAHKQLSKITGTSPFTVAATVQRALGGHALPVDQCMCAILARLNLVSDQDELEQARGSLEHLVPKSKGLEFCLLVSELAADSKRQDAIVASLLPKSSRSKSSKQASDADAKSDASTAGHRSKGKSQSEKPSTSRKSSNSR